MNTSVIKPLFFLLFVSIANLLTGQLSVNSGEVCMLDRINGPTILCQMNALNESTWSTLPPLHTAQPQPPGQLCDNGSGTQGQPDNIVWYAFQAECDEINIRIESRNCSGIQAGIFTDCTFDETIACSSASGVFTVNFNNLPVVLGQTYYLFIDGYDGAMCEYRIIASSSCSTSYTLEPIDAIESSDVVDGGTICEGMRTFFNVGNHSGSNYHWTVTDDSNLEILSDVYLDDEDFSYDFLSSGSFTVSVYSYDDCDETDPVTYNVNVELIPDEIFLPIRVCGECFPFNLQTLDTDCIISGSLHDQDPNGDAILGWGKSRMVMTGNEEIVDTITLASGCIYRQVIYVEDLGINSRINIDTFLCAGDFPVEFNGNTYGIGETASITEPGGADNGCNAFFKYNFLSLVINGDFETECQGGEIQLGFNINNITSSPLTNLKYQWYDDSNVLISTDTFLSTVNLGEEYKLIISVDDIDYSCEFEFTKTIESEDLNPSAPIVDSEIILCSNQDEIKIYVNEDKDISYVWSLSDNLEFITNGTKDTITVKNPEKDFTFTVYSENECGQSESSTGEVIFTIAPDADFDLPEFICVDSTFSITNLVSIGGLNYDWILASAQYVSGDIMIANGTGVYTFDTEGEYDITLTTDNGVCYSTPVTKRINVVAIPAVPDVDCDDSMANQLSFVWTVEDWMTGYSFDYNSNFNDNFVSDTDNGRIVFEGLDAEEEITVTVTFDYGASCGIVEKMITCTSKACPSTMIRIIPAESEICFNEDMPSIQVIPTVDMSGTWSGDYIDQNGFFDPNEAGIGQHEVFYEFTDTDCTYEIKTRIEVLPRPFYISEIRYTDCPVEGDLAELELYVNSGVGELTYFLNDIEKDGQDGKPLFYLAAGIYDLEIMDSNGCVYSDMIEIEDRDVTSLDISGRLRIKSFETEVYTLVTSENFNPTTIEWTLDGVTVCDDVAFCTPEFGIDNGIVTLCVKASDELCEVEDCKDIRIYTPIEFNFPNAFSPGTSGGNGFYMIGSSVSNTEVLGFNIYDRYGNKMQTITDFILGTEMVPVWDGTYNGKKIDPGVYVFILEYLDENGDKNSKTGDITVLH